MSLTPTTLRVGFVTGSTPDKWARNWRERSRVRLEPVPVEQADQLSGLRGGDLDISLVRLPIDREGLHCIPLYEERQVVLAGTEHLIAAAEDEVTVADLDEEQLVIPHQSGWRPSIRQLDWPAMTVKEAVETVAAGTGVAVLPMSVARLHARKDVISRPVADLEPTRIAVAWLIKADSSVIQEFIGVIRGRTSRSSRG